MTGTTEQGTAMVTMGEAARMTGKSKPTISRAIKSGKLSAAPNGSGGYAIDPAELARVFAIRNPGAVTGDGSVKRSVTPAVPPGVPPVSSGEEARLREQVAALEAKLELMRETLEDAREQRDRWADQAERAQRLTDGRESRRGWFGFVRRAG